MHRDQNNCLITGSDHRNPSVNHSTWWVMTVPDHSDHCSWSQHLVTVPDHSDPCSWSQHLITVPDHSDHCSWSQHLITVQITLYSAWSNQSQHLVIVPDHWTWPQCQITVPDHSARSQCQIIALAWFHYKTQQNWFQVNLTGQFCSVRSSPKPDHRRYEPDWDLKQILSDCKKFSEFSTTGWSAVVTK